MNEIYVVYWSQSGNTQAMAEAVGRGIAEGGKEPKVVYVGEVSSADLKDAKAFALGCPAMGAEVLEEKISVSSVPTAGATASGCGTGWTA